ncbi:hypothetical protein SAMN04487912_102343 [Arthrobacter sp. cf158]|nr:hypothetical protein SAMN04487912_102343 [Arthrobacter sp. cf158]
MLRYFSVSTSTWADKIELPTDVFTGGRALNVGVGGSTTFQMEDPGVAEAVTKTAITPLERVLVAEEDGNAVYAGMIYEVDEDPDESTVTVKHHDAAWWILARRYLLSSRGAGAPKGAPIVWTNRTLASLAFLIVDKGLDGGPADRYHMPIVLTADVAGTESRTYEGFKFITVEDALQEIINSDGGPFVDFDVHWNDGKLEWGMRAGGLTPVETANALWEWDGTAAKRELFRPKLNTNAEKVSNLVIGTGEGSGEDLMAASASSFAGSTYPALEKVESFQDMHSAQQLQGRTTAELNAHNEPTQQLSFEIPIGGAVKLGDFILGGTCRVKTNKFLFLGSDWINWRLIQYDFNHEWITLHMQQIGG